MDRLPDLTPKQMAALLVYHRAALIRDGEVRSSDRAIGVDGRVTAINGCVSGFMFGSTTIARLKREGLIVRRTWGYHMSDEALALMPDPPRT